MSSPNEHLQRAESLIEYLESDLSGNPDFDADKGARLAELHLLAANARANIRSAHTLQLMASLMAGDPDTPATDPDTPGESPWAPPTNVKRLPTRTQKPTE